MPTILSPVSWRGVYAHNDDFYEQGFVREYLNNALWDDQFFLQMCRKLLGALLLICVPRRTFPVHLTKIEPYVTAEDIFHDMFVWSSMTKDHARKTSQRRLTVIVECQFRSNDHDYMQGICFNYFNETVVQNNSWYEHSPCFTLFEACHARTRSDLQDLNSLNFCWQPRRIFPIDDWLLIACTQVSTISMTKEQSSRMTQGSSES